MICSPRCSLHGALGWRFTPPDTIDVYEAMDSPAAVEALRRAGFVTVTLHDHEATRFLSCRCAPAPSGA